jgi:Nif-specific regulatory protein
MNSLKDKIELIEKQEITRALGECNYVMVQAARKLGITERMIGYKIRKYNIRIKKGDS